jgi:hypothetical protein
LDESGTELNLLRWLEPKVSYPLNGNPHHRFLATTTSVPPKGSEMPNRIRTSSILMKRSKDVPDFDRVWKEWVKTFRELVADAK